MELHQGQSNLAGSWVTLSYDESEETNKSLDLSCSSELERLLHEAQKEGSTPPTSKCNSVTNSLSKPQSIENSPRVSLHSTGRNSPNITDATTQLQQATPNLTDVEKDADWVWNWSSQPTCIPAKEHQFYHPKPKRTPLSLRNTSVMKHGIFSWEFLQVFIPSLIVTNILAFGIGVYVGKKMAAAARNT